MKRHGQAPHPREDFASGLVSRLSQDQLSLGSARKPPYSVRPDVDQERKTGTGGMNEGPSNRPHPSYFNSNGDRIDRDANRSNPF
jgi:hypothetical protein